MLILSQRCSFCYFYFFCISSAEKTERKTFLISCHSSRYPTYPTHPPTLSLPLPPLALLSLHFTPFHSYFHRNGSHQPVQTFGAVSQKILANFLFSWLIKLDFPAARSAVKNCRRNAILGRALRVINCSQQRREEFNRL